jgi:Heterokaryon incompatibility protein (HET)
MNTFERVLAHGKVPELSSGCSRCKNLDFGALIPRPGAINWPLNQHRSQYYLLTFGTIDAIRERPHCKFCNFILEIWTRFSTTDSPTVSESSVVCEIWRAKYPHFFPYSIKISAASATQNNDPILALVRFRISTSTYLDPCQFVYLSHPVVSASERSPRPRPAKSTESAFVNFDLINKWIEHCGKGHNCEYRRWTLRENFTISVIDVWTRRVIAPPEGAQYVALSYVWGQQAQYPMEGSHESDTLGSLPQTVEDAIEIAKRLNQQYLWVDAYCIGQEGESHRLSQIKNMDWIYENAFFTIVAASALHSNQGIAGVSSPLINSHQPMVETPNGMIMATFTRDHTTDVPNWPWSSRAWTLQEGALSKKLIVFTDHNYLFKCKVDLFTDVLGFHESPINHSTGYGDFFNGTVWRFQWYAEAVETYCARAMSRQSDILHAFAGLLTRVTLRTQVKFFWGIPLKSAAASLCWINESDVNQRRARFPSWSWCGWYGRVSYKHLRSLTESETEQTAIRPLSFDADDLRIEVTSEWVSASRLGKIWFRPGVISRTAFDEISGDLDSCMLVRMLKHQDSMVSLLIRPVTDRWWERVGVVTVYKREWTGMEPKQCSVVLE